MLQLVAELSRSPMSSTLSGGTFGTASFSRYPVEITGPDTPVSEIFDLGAGQLCADSDAYSLYKVVECFMTATGPSYYERHYVSGWEGMTRLVPYALSLYRGGRKQIFLQTENLSKIHMAYAEDTLRGESIAYQYQNPFITMADNFARYAPHDGVFGCDHVHAIDRVWDGMEKHPLLGKVTPCLFGTIPVQEEIARVTNIFRSPHLLDIDTCTSDVIDLTLPTYLPEALSRSLKMVGADDLLNRSKRPDRPIIDVSTPPPIEVDPSTTWVCDYVDDTWGQSITQLSEILATDYDGLFTFGELGGKCYPFSGNYHCDRYMRQSDIQFGYIGNDVARITRALASIMWTVVHGVVPHKNADRARWILTHREAVIIRFRKTFLDEILVEIKLPGQDEVELGLYFDMAKLMLFGSAVAVA